MRRQALLIGCGKMGGALLERWVLSECYEFSVVDPVAESVPEGAHLFRTAEALRGQKFDLIIIALKPQMIDQFVPEYAEYLVPSGLLVSIAAGYAVERLRAHFASVPTIRLMPNLPASIGRGVNGLFATPDVSAKDRKDITDLMDLTGLSIWVESEDVLDRVTVLASCGVGFFFEIARSFVAAAGALEFDPGQARELVLTAFSGAADLAIRSDLDLATLRNNVTSKNGVTQAGLEQLRQDGILDSLTLQTFQAAYARAVELR